MCRDGKVELRVVNKQTIIWQDGDTSHRRLVTKAGKYWVKSKGYCGEQRDSIQIDIENDSVKLIVPNVFTPNGDSYNGLYQIGGLKENCQEIEMKIYDRWGLLVFEGQMPEQSWDGTYFNTGKPLSSGLYYYIFRSKDQNSVYGEPVEGVVHLIR